MEGAEEAEGTATEGSLEEGTGGDEDDEEAAVELFLDSDPFAADGDGEDADAAASVLSLGADAATAVDSPAGGAGDGALFSSCDMIERFESSRDVMSVRS